MSGPLFATDQDVSLVKQWTAERVSLSVPERKFIAQVRDPERIDQLYGYPLNGREWEDPIMVPVYIDPQPEEITLTNLGWQQMHPDMIGVITCIHAEERGMVPLDGDVVVFQEKEFKMLNVVRNNFWGSVGEGMDWVFTLSERGLASTRDNRADTSDGDIPEGLLPFPDFEEAPVTDESGDVIGIF